MIKKLLERWFIKNKVKNKQHEALKRRLAIIYAVVGWNMFGVLFYTIVKRKVPEDATERRISYGLLTGASNNMHVYQVTGLTFTNDFDVTYKNEITQVEKENEKNEKAIANEI